MLFSTIRANRDDPEKYGAYCTVSSKTLATKVGEMVTLLRDTALLPNFDETVRIRDLIKQFRVRRDAGITGNGPCSLCWQRQQACDQSRR